MSDIEKQIKDAAVHAANGKLRGHYVIGPDGQLVIARPGVVQLAVSAGKSVVGGLKAGWRLGCDADVKRKVAEGEAQDKARAKSEKDGVKMEAIPSK